MRFSPFIEVQDQMTYQEDLIHFLQQSELFRNFSYEELEAFLPLIQEKSFDKDVFILQEGTKGEELYLIKRGKVSILVADQEHGGYYNLATLKPLDCLGEMCILGSESTTASGKTLEPTEVIAFNLYNLNQLAQDNPIFVRFLFNLTKQAGRRLKQANETAIKSTKEELKLTKTHDQMGKFIIHLFILLTFYFYILKIFEEYNMNSALIRLISAGLIFCFALSGFHLVKSSGFPLEFYGLTLKNWRKNLGEGILFTIPLLLLMVALKWVLITTIPDFEDLSLIQIGNPSPPFLYFFHPSDHRVRFFTLLSLYILFVPLQEFIARGCLQSCLRNFFRSPHRSLLAILTSNLLFGLFHGLKSFSFVGAAFTLGLFWGWLYQRQNSILGPTVSHALVGLWAFGILNYQSLLTF